VEGGVQQHGELRDRQLEDVPEPEARVRAKESANRPSPVETNISTRSIPGMSRSSSGAWAWKKTAMTIFVVTFFSSVVARFRSARVSPWSWKVTSKTASKGCGLAFPQ